MNNTSLPQRIVCLSAHFFWDPTCDSSAIDCADTSVVRTSSRQELLFVRSQIVITAKAFGLEAIDMVCVSLALRFAISRDIAGVCELQGPRIPAGGMRRRQATGLHGKGGLLHSQRLGTLMLNLWQQAIHPNQVATVNASFVPTFHGEASVLSRIPCAYG